MSHFFHNSCDFLFIKLSRTIVIQRIESNIWNNFDIVLQVHANQKILKQIGPHQNLLGLFQLLCQNIVVIKKWIVLRELIGRSYLLSFNVFHFVHEAWLKLVSIFQFLLFSYIIHILIILILDPFFIVRLCLLGILLDHQLLVYLIIVLIRRNNIQQLLWISLSYIFEETDKLIFSSLHFLNVAHF